MDAVTHCTVIELRQYTLHPGQREVLIELFEREFLQAQEAGGIGVIGQFRDLGDPDRFVWLRGFADMPSRARALQAFYGGPVWQAHRERANATLVDSDNVLLLRPATAARFELAPRPGADVNEATFHGGRVVATVCPLASPASPALLEHFDHVLKPALQRSGASILGVFETENSANNYPRLPVRDGEQVFVWLSGHRDRANAEGEAAALAGLQPWLRAAPQVLRLEPTTHSRMHV